MQLNERPRILGLNGTLALECATFIHTPARLSLSQMRLTAAQGFSISSLKLSQLRLTETRRQGGESRPAQL